MILKCIAIIFLAAACSAQTVTTNSTWTFTKGGKFEGRPIDFKGTNIVTMVSAKDGKSYALGIATMIPKDGARLLALIPQVVMQKGAAELKAAGYIELSTSLFDNFPEKVDGKNAWLDGTFSKVDNGIVHIYMSSWEDILLGFAMLDKNGNSFDYAIVDKKNEFHAGLDDALLKLKPGDRIRVRGNVTRVISSRLFLWVHKIEIVNQEGAISAYSYP